MTRWPPTPAAGDGWSRSYLGQHLHEIVDPDAVADRLIRMAQHLAATRA